MTSSDDAESDFAEADSEAEAFSGEDEPTGVDKLISRFGPVPERTGDRPSPGPRPSVATFSRPEPGAQTHRTNGQAAAGSLIAPAPLFDEPHDDVFGEAPIGVGSWTDPDEPPPFVDIDAGAPIEVVDRRDWVRMPRRTGPTFRFLVVGFVLFIGAISVYGRVTTWWDDQVDPPGEPGDAVEFTIPSGAAANEVTQRLYADGVIANPTLFRYWLSDNLEGGFQAGDYTCLQENMSFQEALDCLQDVGPVPPKFFSITIPEGLRLDEIIDVLHAENPEFAKADLEKNLDASLVTVTLSGTPERPRPDSPDPTGSGKEGMLFPATYQVDDKRASDSLDILRRMAETMDLKFNEAVADVGRDPVIEELGLSDYEVLIIASLLEEEYLVDRDIGKISRVIYNRLLHGRTSLGIDASACYAAQIPCSDLTIVEIDSPSPWNTRNLRNYGLPPTPISAPGEKAIRAALNPEPGEWFFYVRTEEDGGHTFDITLAEHNESKKICQARGYCN